MAVECKNMQGKLEWKKLMNDEYQMKLENMKNVLEEDITNFEAESNMEKLLDKIKIFKAVKARLMEMANFGGTIPQKLDDAEKLVQKVEIESTDDSENAYVESKGCFSEILVICESNRTHVFPIFGDETAAKSGEAKYKAEFHYEFGKNGFKSGQKEAGFEVQKHAKYENGVKREFIDHILDFRERKLFWYFMGFGIPGTLKNSGELKIFWNGESKQFFAFCENGISDKLLGFYEIFVDRLNPPSQATVYCFAPSKKVTTATTDEERDFGAENECKNDAKMKPPAPTVAKKPTPWLYPENEKFRMTNMAENFKQLREQQKDAKSEAANALTYILAQINKSNTVTKKPYTPSKSVSEPSDATNAPPRDEREEAATPKNATADAFTTEYVLEPFTGSPAISFESWLTKFQYSLAFVNTITPLDDARKLGRLLAYLQGAAKLAYESYDDDVKTDYGRLTTALKDSFTNAGAKRTANSALSCCFQKPDESVHDFSTRLTELVRTANEGETPATIKIVLAWQLKEKLRDDIKAKINIHDCTTFEEVLRKALDRENYVAQKAQYAAKKPVGDANFAEKRSIQCWVCHKIGHFARDCLQSHRRRPPEFNYPRHHNYRNHHCDKYEDDRPQHYRYSPQQHHQNSYHPKDSRYSTYRNPSSDDDRRSRHHSYVESPNTPPHRSNRFADSNVTELKDFTQFELFHFELNTTAPKTEAQTYAEHEIPQQQLVVPPPQIHSPQQQPQTHAQQDLVPPQPQQPPALIPQQPPSLQTHFAPEQQTEAPPVAQQCHDRLLAPQHTYSQPPAERPPQQLQAPQQPQLCSNATPPQQHSHPPLVQAYDQLLLPHQQLVPPQKGTDNTQEIMLAPQQPFNERFCELLELENMPTEPKWEYRKLYDVEEILKFAKIGFRNDAPRFLTETRDNHLKKFDFYHFELAHINDIFLEQISNELFKYLQYYRNSNPHIEHEYRQPPSLLAETRLKTYILGEVRGISTVILMDKFCPKSFVTTSFLQKMDSFGEDNDKLILQKIVGPEIPLETISCLHIKLNDCTKEADLSSIDTTTIETSFEILLGRDSIKLWPNKTEFSKQFFKIDEPLIKQKKAATSINKGDVQISIPTAPQLDECQSTSPTLAEIKSRFDAMRISNPPVRPTTSINGTNQDQQQ